MASGRGQQRLLDRLGEVVDRYGDQIAVREPGRAVTYDQLAASIAALRRQLVQTDEPPGSPIGLLLERSATAYASLLAAISLGRPYVPLNPSHPPSRLREIAEQADVGDVVGLSTTSPDELDSLGRRRILADELGPAGPTDLAAVWASDPAGETAYQLFTSGSTGRPKGVPITYTSLLAFVEAMDATIPIVPDDVCTQVCELSFDFSVHEIFLTLLNGGTLCPARAIDLFEPAGYVEANDITVWIGVPSLARVVLDGHRPPGDRLAGLRLSIFNGEALTSTLAARWHEAAPNSEIWNTYGPTECTVAATAQRWTPVASGDDRSDDTADDGLGERLEHDGVVAIGTALPGCRTAIDDGGTIIPTAAAPPDTTGELLLAGPQRFAGYLDQDLPSPLVTEGSTTWYRTGDRVRWSANRLFHLGRLDHQVKVGGHRIELQEVEHRLRDTLGIEALAVIAHPEDRPAELVLCLGGAAPAAITAEETGLPRYMLPKRILTLPALPTGAHGKVDRRELHRLADARR